MHQKLSSLKPNSLYYTDCDSIIYKSLKNEPSLFPISNNFGLFKNEISGYNCICAVILGCKSLALLLQSKTTGEFKSIFKLKGLSLNSAIINSHLNFYCYENEFKEFLDSSISYTSILQLRSCKTKWEKSTLMKRFTLIAFSNSLLSKRAKVNKDYSTSPYGYKVVEERKTKRL